jgi:branched-chain amino acid transport system ATP-binding protein
MPLPNGEESNGSGKSNAAFLQVEDLSVNYGAIEAVRGIGFDVQKGEILCLIGANGAGKTTILHAISGLLKPKKGKIVFKGETISQLPAHAIVQRGLCQAPEGRGIFLNLTVEENLDLGAWVVKDKSRFSADLERVFTLFPRLKERRRQNAGTLSGGEQQMLAIGRALMAHPECLLLDEPSLGLAPQFIERIFSVIREINAQGVTILLVEQNAALALELAHRGLVLETGTVKMAGPARELLKSDEVRKAYLGE